MSKPNPRRTIEAGNIESIAYFLSLDSMAMNEANNKPIKKPKVPDPRENTPCESSMKSIRIANSETVVIANTERVRINDSPSRLLIILISHGAQEFGQIDTCIPSNVVQRRKASYEAADEVRGG